MPFTTLFANSADDKLMIFFFYFSQEVGFDISFVSSDIGILSEVMVIFK